jgi:hypothetical protein
MAVAPIIKPITTRKGIFYTFQSSLEDLTLSFNNSGNQFKFSNFVLLNLPNVGTPDGTASDNKLFFKAQGESLMTDPGLYNQSNQNYNLAQSFQNYALNLEALLISQASYNRELPLNVSERVFWKWLKEAGAIRWRDSNTLETSTTGLFTEEDEQVGSSYAKVVQYIGEIDIVNSYKGKENSYSELYLHVPNNVGSTPYVLFKSLSDDNYKPNMAITNAPELPEDRETIAGRHYTDVHPQGLSLNAFYDLDDSTVLLEQAPYAGSTYTALNWFQGTLNNSYYTDGTYDAPSATWKYNTAVNKKIKKSKTTGGVTTTINYTRSTLDGVCVDFALTDYLVAVQNAKTSFSGINDINVQNKNFDFNTVLVYYDVIDPVTKALKAKNLYGILFLNKIQSNGLEFEIPRLTKYKPDPLSKINGNSYAFKLNVKFDTSIEDVAVEPVKNINANAGFSLDLFVDLMNKFQTIAIKQDDKFAQLTTLQKDWEKVKASLLTTSKTSDLETRLTNLEKALLANSALFLNTKNVVEKITNVEGQLANFVDGKTSLEVAYNTDVVKSGTGIGISRAVGNQVTINNETPDYNFETTPVFNISTATSIPLVPFSNYYRHEKAGNSHTLTGNLVFKIDDTLTQWKKGQVLRLVFADPVILNGYTITLSTDALARSTNLDFSTVTQPYNTKIGIITDYGWSSDNRPIFEIICTNSLNLDFKIDRIR